MAATRKRNSLTAFERRFVDEYLVDLNARLAYDRAGGARKSARTLGPRLLLTPRVAKAVAAAEDRRSVRTEITGDRVLQELGRIGFSDMTAFAAWDKKRVTLRNSQLLTEDQSRCVAEVSEGQLGVRIKLHDKVGALEKIGRHLGMFVDRTLVTTVSLEEIIARSRAPLSPAP